MRRWFILALCAVALASCRGPFSNVWEDPEWEGAPLENVLVVGKTADGATRRTYEDALTARLEAIGVRAEPSYRQVPDGAITPEAIASAIAAGGQDGWIAARLVGVDERARHQPGTMRRSGAARGWRTWDGFSDPGTWRIDRIARVETQVWSLADEGTMVWVATSETVNPRNVSTVAQSLADSTVRELQRAGILPGD